MKKIWLRFDEFFKIGMKTFFEAFKFIVQTEFELFKLPKKLDVLIIKPGKKPIPKQFHAFKYFKEHNLISFKSPLDRIKERDIRDAIIYLNGYLNITKGANYSNTTITILCNHTPKSFLKKYARNISEVEEGIWHINFGLFAIYLHNLNLSKIKGIDDCFLKDFADTEAFRESIRFQQNVKVSRKIFDILKEFLYIRINSFETTEFREVNMPVAMKADITDMVLPFVEKAEKKGKREGKLEAARAMKKKGFSNELISEIVGLSIKELKKRGI